MAYPLEGLKLLDFSRVLAERLNKPQSEVDSLLESGVLLFEDGWRPKGA